MIESTNRNPDDEGQQSYMDRCEEMCKAAVGVIQHAGFCLFLRRNLIVQTGLKTGCV